MAPAVLDSKFQRASESVGCGEDVAQEIALTIESNVELVVISVVYASGSSDSMLVVPADDGHLTKNLSWVPEVKHAKTIKI